MYDFAHDCLFPLCLEWRGRKFRALPCSALPCGALQSPSISSPIAAASIGGRLAQPPARIRAENGPIVSVFERPADHCREFARVGAGGTGARDPSFSDKSGPRCLGELAVQRTWWQRGIIYQIYPRSFMDSNADGIGDLRGILARLDHLVSLGVDAIWLSPIYPSPMRDFGYDVSDYTDVDPMFGTLADFDELRDAIHRRGLKLILDFVPNHTSDQHPWFRESRAARTSAKRDWYLWRDPAPDGGPPNNWQSTFGGSGWEFDPATGQYYYHAFLASQPDLNWRNPQVRAAMYDVLRFWLNRGVDGFRVDVLWHLIKDDQFRDNPLNPRFLPGDSARQRHVMLYSADRPEVQEVVAGLRRVVDEYTDRVLIGEIYLPIERLVAYYGANLDGAHLPFNFQLIETPWSARGIAALIDAYESALPPGGWPNWVLGNHDRPRIASRVGIAQARVAAVLLLTLRGTPTLYYGDEIGMEDVKIPPNRVRDPCGKSPDCSEAPRDPCRTPMQWDGTANAGFTSGDPWLPLDDDYPVVNVAAQTEDPTSMLALYRRLIALRRAHPALAYGDYRQLAMEGDLIAYVRELEGERFLIALNLGAEPHAVSFADAAGRQGRIALSTHLDRADEPAPGEVNLRADEAVIIALQ
jgi:alpha-glucosidase